jgi:hypothetical protein
MRKRFRFQPNSIVPLSPENLNLIFVASPALACHDKGDVDLNAANLEREWN